jgi:hypothetical protein
MRHSILAAALILNCGVWVMGGAGLAGLYRRVPKDMISQTNHGDFIYPWYGSRELLVHRRDPYGNDVTQEIRRMANVQERNPNWGQFIYPAYTAFLVSPTLWMPFQIAQLFFFCVLLPFVPLSLYFWLRFVDLKLSVLGFLIAAALAMASPPVVQGLLLRQVGVLVAILISGAAVLLRYKYFFFSGCLLALTTVKPQMVVLLVPWLLAWSVADWRKRKGLVFGFGTVMILLLAGSELLLPGWISEWIAAIETSKSYRGVSMLETLDGHALGLWASIVVLIWMAFILFKLQRAPTDSEDFAMAFSLVLLVQLLVSPLMAGFNHLLIVPAVLLLAKHFMIKKKAGQKHPG